MWQYKQKYDLLDYRKESKMKDIQTDLTINRNYEDSPRIRVGMYCMQDELLKAFHVFYYYLNHEKSDRFHLSIDLVRKGKKIKHESCRIRKREISVECKYKTVYLKQYYNYFDLAYIPSLEVRTLLSDLIFNTDFSSFVNI